MAEQCWEPLDAKSIRCLGRYASHCARMETLSRVNIHDSRPCSAGARARKAHDSFCARCSQVPLFEGMWKPENKDFALIVDMSMAARGRDVRFYQARSGTILASGDIPTRCIVACSALRRHYSRVVVWSDAYVYVNNGSLTIRILRAAQWYFTSHLEPEKPKIVPVIQKIAWQLGQHDLSPWATNNCMACLECIFGSSARGSLSTRRTKGDERLVKVGRDTLESLRGFPAVSTLSLSVLSEPRCPTIKRCLCRRPSRLRRRCPRQALQQHQQQQHVRTKVTLT